jgi:hypothetical protein
MKKRNLVLFVLGAATFLLFNDLVGSTQAKHTLVKIGGMKNKCECTYRIE